MPQKDVIRNTGQVWNFLEPAEDPNSAREDHIVLLEAGAGLYVSYRKGQIVLQKNDGTNKFAIIGTSGYGGPPRIMKYSVLVNDAGHYQMTDNAVWNANARVYENSIDAYYAGKFKTQDLIGAGGTNEVQTETVTATGGTRTLKFGPYTTAPIAYNANAAAIKAALLLACPNLTTADIAVTGTGPYVYTFGGAYAGANVPLLVVGTASLTGGSSSFAETTPGAGLLTGVGKLLRGTSSSGIMELGAATPV